MDVFYLRGDLIMVFIFWGDLAVKTVKELPHIQHLPCDLGHHLVPHLTFPRFNCSVNMK